MNKRYEAALEEIKKRDNVNVDQLGAKEPVERPDTASNKKFGEKMIEFSKPVKDHPGVRRMGRKAILRTLGENWGENRSQMVMIKLMTKRLASKFGDFQLVFGSLDDLKEYRAKKYPETRNQKTGLGWIDFANKTIYISNLTRETVMHEIAHALTQEAVYKHAGKDYEITKETDTDAVAVRNLENLMDRFMKLDLSLMGEGTAQAGATLQSEIRSKIAAAETPELGRADALMEFIAWTLSNQNLIEALKKTRAASKLYRLADAVLKGIRKLLGLPASSSLDMFSNIQWNTAALIQASSDKAPYIDRPLSQVDPVSQGMPRREKLSYLDGLYEQRVAKFLRERVKDVERDITKRKMDTAAKYTLADFEHVYQWSGENRAVFKRLVSALSGAMEVDARSMTQLERLFKHAVKNLSVDDFREVKDPAQQIPGDRDEKQAQERYDLVLGLARPQPLRGGDITPTEFQTDMEGRRTVLASFLALSQVDEDFRSVLRRMDMPKGTEQSRESVDKALETFGSRMMESLSDKVVRTAGRPDVALDRIAMNIGQIEADRRTEIEKTAMGLMDKADGAVAGYFSDVGEKLSRFAQGRADAQRKEDRQAISKAMDKLMEKSAKGAAVLINKEKGQIAAEALVSLSNQSEAIREKDGWNASMASLVPNTVWSLIRETLGMLPSSKEFLSLMNRVKYAISAVRQEYREKLPEQLAKQFKKPLNKHTWTDLYEVLARTDISSLVSVLQPKQILEILRVDGAREQMIVTTKSDLRTSKYSHHFNRWDREAKALAKMMVTGKIDPGNHDLKKNAEAIFFGGGQNLSKINRADFKEIDTIDNLITLYALDLQAKENPQLYERIKTLATEEGTGIEYAISFLHELRSTEISKATSGEARANMWKGYAPAENADGMRLKVVPLAKHRDMLRTGYTYMGEYVGSGLERGAAAKMGVYSTNVGGKGTFVQGVLQTVQKTAGGVDVYSGHTLGSGLIQTGGRVSVKDFDRIHSAVKRGKYKTSNGESALIPLRDRNMEVFGYERSIDPERASILRPNMRLDEMIGAWKGRQAEEAISEAYNQTAVDRLHDMYKKTKGVTDKNEYVDLSDPEARSKKKEWEDAWSILPRETKNYIAAKFGKSGFMVRRDVLDNAMGYRMMSLGSPWQETSNMKPETQKAIRDTLDFVMPGAYKKIITAEKYWQAGVSFAKQTIVIRSVIVPASNIASNVLQLAAVGVPLRLISRGFRDGLVEIDAHLKRQARRAEIDADIAFYRFRKEETKVKQLEAEKATLDEADRRMKIWDLIEAGEFSTISEGLTDADAAISKGKISDYLEGLAENLPNKLGTFGRYGYITKDTALFKGMSRAVMYGDFLAKAVLYDHLTNRGENGKKLNKKDAMFRVTEEFVNYNLLPGRVRNYAESMGLAWFWAYKLRSLKVAHRMLRDNPMRALLMSVGTPWLPDIPGVDVGSPVTDNAGIVIAEGRAPYALGTGMLSSGITLNPWVNMVN